MGKCKVAEIMKEFAVLLICILSNSNALDVDEYCEESCGLGAACYRELLPGYGEEVRCESCGPGFFPSFPNQCAKPGDNCESACGVGGVCWHQEGETFCKQCGLGFKPRRVPFKCKRVGQKFNLIRRRLRMALRRRNRF